MAHLAARVASKGHRAARRAAKQQKDGKKKDALQQKEEGILEPFNVADGAKASLTTAGGGGAAL